MRHRITINFNNAEHKEIVLQNESFSNKVLNGDGELAGNSISFTDNVKNNTEQTFRAQTLTQIKDILVSVLEGDYKNMLITNTEAMLPNGLWVRLDTMNNRIICTVTAIEEVPE